MRRFFKPARLGPDGRRTLVERPRPGLRIVRDRWDVPHVYGRTRSDVMFGAGWATAADRGLLMNLLRGPGRIAALDAPGLNAYALATSARPFVSSQQTEAFRAAQAELAAAHGPDAAAWRDDATGERIRFGTFMASTMRFSNRPTFQQVMTFTGHGARR